MAAPIQQEQQPQPQPQPHLHQEVEFEHGRRHLAIVLDKERRALLVRRRPAPDTLVGLVLDPNLEQHTEQLLRERLVWRLSRVSLDGVPMPAALPPAAYYLYSPEQEQKLFGHCMQRVGAMLNLPPDALAGPGRRGRKRVDSHAAGSSGAAAADGAKRTKRPTAKAYVLVVKMDLVPLLKTHISLTSCRIKASSSLLTSSTKPSTIPVVLRLEGTSSPDGLPWFVEKEAKQGIEAAVERGFGKAIVRLRGAFRTDPQEILTQLPIVIGNAHAASLSSISLRIHELISPLLGGTTESCASGWGKLPDLAISHILSFHATPQRAATSMLINKRWGRLAAEAVLHVGLASLPAGANGAGRQGGGTTLLARLPRMEQLRLADGDAMVEATRAFKRGWQWPQLRALELPAWAANFNNRPQKGCLDGLMTSVKQHGLPSLQSLSVYLADNRSDLSPLASAVVPEMLASVAMPNLQELQITGRYGVTGADVEALARGLGTRPLRVLRLDMSSCPPPMPVDTLLASCPGLTSLSLAWPLPTQWRNDPQQRARRARRAAEGVELLAAALPAMSGLRVLELRVDLGLTVSVLPLLERLTMGFGRPRLQRLHVEGFEEGGAVAGDDRYRVKYVAAAWRALVANGSLGQVKELRMVRCGLHAAHVFSILREAKVGHGMSLLPALQLLDVSGNALLAAEDEEEGGLMTLPAGAEWMPPALTRFVAVGSGVGGAALTRLQGALHPVVVEM